MVEELNNNSLTKLRFLDENGETYPDWEEKRLGEIVEFKMGFTPSTKNNEFWEGENHWLSIRGLEEGKYIYSGNKFISDTAIKNKKSFPPETLLMSFKLSVGKLGITKIPLYTNEAICGFEKSSFVTNEFLYYSLKCIDFSSIGKTAVKGKTLNTQSIKNIKINLPSLPEQEKIVEFLSSLDNRIDEQLNKLEQLKLEKQSYMQKVLM